MRHGVSATSEKPDEEPGRMGDSPDGTPSNGRDSSPPPSRQLELEVSLLGSVHDGARRDELGGEVNVAGSEGHGQGAGAVVLLLIEDGDMRGYLRGCLAQETTGIARVLEANSLPTATRQAADHAVDVIIVEGTAVSGTGVLLYQALRDQDEFRELPVILVVDEPISEEVRRSSSATLRVLARPFNASRLCETVRRTIQADANTRQMRGR